MRPLLIPLLLTALLLLLLGLHLRGGNAGAALELQTSFAGGGLMTAGVAPDPAGSGSEFPADFSADLSVDPASGFLAPVSRGSSSGSGAAVAAMALTRLGDSCFQPQAAPGEYLDCSALVQWCYERLGASVPRTAADQAKYCQEHFLTIPRSQLQCGDLIFWSFEKNGRFQNISHTGIYAGDGKIIDASYSRSQVVYRDLYDPEKIVMCGRIPVKQ